MGIVRYSFKTAAQDEDVAVKKGNDVGTHCSGVASAANSSSSSYCCASVVLHDTAGLALAEAVTLAKNMNAGASITTADDDNGGGNGARQAVCPGSKPLVYFVCPGSLDLEAAGLGEDSARLVAAFGPHLSTEALPRSELLCVRALRMCARMCVCVCVCVCVSLKWMGLPGTALLKLRYTFRLPQHRLSYFPCFVCVCVRLHSTNIFIFRFLVVVVIIATSPPISRQCCSHPPATSACFRIAGTFSVSTRCLILYSWINIRFIMNALSDAYIYTLHLQREGFVSVNCNINAICEGAFFFSSFNT